MKKKTTENVPSVKSDVDIKIFYAQNPTHIHDQESSLGHSMMMTTWSKVKEKERRLQLKGHI